MVNFPKELTLIGAYGREATLADWKAGKDFQIYGGPYCSIRDTKRMKADGYTDVTLLRRDATVVAMINIDEAIASTYKEPSLS
jgi:hypothetical protein